MRKVEAEDIEAEEAREEAMMKCPHCGFYHLAAQERCAKCKKPFNSEAAFEGSESGIESSVAVSPPPESLSRPELQPPEPVILDPAGPDPEVGRPDSQASSPPRPIKPSGGELPPDSPAQEITRPDPTPEAGIREEAPDKLKDFWGDEDSATADGSSSLEPALPPSESSQSGLSLSGDDGEPDALLLAALDRDDSLELGSVVDDDTAELLESDDEGDSSAERRFDHALAEVDEALRSAPEAVLSAAEAGDDSHELLSASLIDGLDQVIQSPAELPPSEPLEETAGSAEFDEESFALSDEAVASAPGPEVEEQTEKSGPPPKPEPRRPESSSLPPPAVAESVLSPIKPRPGPDPSGQDHSLLSLMETELEQREREAWEASGGLRPSQPEELSCGDEGGREGAAPLSAEKEKGIRVLRWERNPGLEAGPESLALRRAAAGALDFMVFAGIGFALFAAARLLGVFVGLHGSPAQWLQLVALPLAMISGILALIYGGVFTGLTGQTPGMMLLKLKLSGLDGSAPSLSRAFKRTGVLIACLLPLGLGLLTMLVKHEDHSLFDRFTGTRIERS